MDERAPRAPRVERLTRVEERAGEARVAPRQDCTKIQPLRGFAHGAADADSAIKRRLHPARSVSVVAELRVAANEDDGEGAPGELAKGLARQLLPDTLSHSQAKPKPCLHTTIVIIQKDGNTSYIPDWHKDREPDGMPSKEYHYPLDVNIRVSH